MGKQHPIEIFMPPNMLKAKLGGSDGAGIDTAAIKRAETAIEKIKGDFPDWIAEDIQLLVKSSESFFADGNNDAAGRLFRASHDLRGQAGTFEYPLIARIAGSLCKLIEVRDDADDTTRALILTHVEAIRAIFRDKVKSMSDRTALELTEELEMKVRATVERAAAKRA